MWCVEVQSEIPRWWWQYSTETLYCNINSCILIMSHSDLIYAESVILDTVIGKSTKRILPSLLKELFCSVYCAVVPQRDLKYLHWYFSTVSRRCYHNGEVRVGWKIRPHVLGPFGSDVKDVKRWGLFVSLNRHAAVLFWRGFACEKYFSGFCFFVFCLHLFTANPTPLEITLRKKKKETARHL